MDLGYRDDYRDDYRGDLDRDLDPPLPSSYARDHRGDPYYDDKPSRERVYDYDERDRPPIRSTYPPPPPPPPSILDDPFYRRFDDLEARILSRAREPLPPPLPPPLSVHDEPGALVHGSVIIIPFSPFEHRPKRREKPPNCNTVFVGSLPEKATEKHLFDIFMKCGKIIDVRVSRGRNFGHVQFQNEESIEKAMDLSGCIIRIGPSNLPGDSAKIHVDYAHSKGEAELQRRIQEGELLSFNHVNASTVSSDLHREEAFGYAAKNVIHWLERGHCTQSTANTFFGLISSTNTHCRKMIKHIKAKDEELAEVMQKRREYFQTLQKECAALEEVFDVASQQKSRDHFTKPQRKSLSQWKEHAAEVHSQVQKVLKEGEGSSGEAKEPPRKIMRTASLTELEADLDRARKEISQLSTDHDMALEKKDKQILQLKTLLAQFKQSCPQEWEKAIGGGGAKTEGKKKEEKAAAERSPKEEEEEEEEGGKTEGGGGGEIIDGVSLEDLNTAMDLEGENTLAEAAAAYAQMQSKIGSSDVPGSTITEPEAAIVSVLASFLTVHPLGASLEEITSYFQAFSPAYNSYYLESLLRRLPHVFQLSQATDGGGGRGGGGGGGGAGKWWFLGFQTCCNQGQYSQQQQQQQSVKMDESSEPGSPDS